MISFPCSPPPDLVTRALRFPTGIFLFPSSSLPSNPMTGSITSQFRSKCTCKTSVSSPGSPVATHPHILRSGLPKPLVFSHVTIVLPMLFLCVKFLSPPPASPFIIWLIPAHPSRLSSESFFPMTPSSPNCSQSTCTYHNPYCCLSPSLSCELLMIRE